MNYEYEGWNGTKILIDNISCFREMPHVFGQYVSCFRAMSNVFGQYVSCFRAMSRVFGQSLLCVIIRVKNRLYPGH